MKEYENYKENLVQECLAEIPLAVALYFSDKKAGSGFVLASMGKHPGQPWFPVEVSEKLAGGHASGTKTPGAKKIRQVGIVMGIGNRSELLSVIDIYRGIIHAEVIQLGFHEKFDDEILKGLAGELNAEYRAGDPEIPYRVELLVISFTNKTLKLNRIKADGDMHSLQNFGVIGGYQEIKTDQTIRSVAIRHLQHLYSKGVPTLKLAMGAVNAVMSLDGIDYPHNFVSIAKFQPPK